MSDMVLNGDVLHEMPAVTSAHGTLTRKITYGCLALELHEGQEAFEHRVGLLHKLFLHRTSNSRTDDR